MDLSKCQIFTPPHIVKYMLDKIDYDAELLNDLFLSCEDLRQQIHMKKE